MLMTVLISIEHRLYSSPLLGAVGDTPVNQTDTVPALMELSQVHLQEALTSGQGCVLELSGKSEGPLKMVTFHLAF